MVSACPEPPSLPAPLCCNPPVSGWGKAAGPDIAGIACWVPGQEGCCPSTACTMDEWEFLCSIRSLLPEGEIYNNTQQAITDPPKLVGAVTVGCMRVGCEQLIFGGCCDDSQILCTDEPIAPQLAVVDAFAVAAFGVIKSLCAIQGEADPCTATAGLTLEKWGRRLGLVTDDPCDPRWSDEVLSVLICVSWQLKRTILNYESLQTLAARFGSTLQLRAAGDINCGPGGWITMARDRNLCPPDETCPPGLAPITPPIVRLVSGCESLPESLNIVLCPSEIRLQENCNLPQPQLTLPHDPELYRAFKWLLPRIMPQPAFYCYYECGEPDECVQ